jgi:hypothetical protein
VAKIFITELKDMAASDSGATLQIAKLPPLAEQEVTITGSSAQSAALNAETKFVRVTSDSVAHLAFGSNPTATVGGLRMAAGSVEYFGVVGGSKIAAILGV